MNLNPFAHLAISYQEILFFPGPFGHWKWLVALGVASAAFFLFGYLVFDRLRDSLAEEVLRRPRPVARRSRWCARRSCTADILTVSSLRRSKARSSRYP
jgi:hypothetical protein